MANVEVLPSSKYKVISVGPTKKTSFPARDGSGNVEFNVTSVQFEGQSMWVEVNTGMDKPLPKVGDELEGHVEQDEAGKYLPKFKKANKGGGNWGGGGSQASPGAIWSARLQTAADLVTWYYTTTGTKPKDFDEVLARIKATAVDVNKLIDELVKVEELTKPTAAPAAPATNNEAGETPSPTAPAPGVQVDDIDEKELGKW